MDHTREVFEAVLQEGNERYRGEIVSWPSPAASSPWFGLPAPPERLALPGPTIPLLQTRTKGLKNELERVFRRWYPRFRDQAACPPTS